MTDLKAILDIIGHADTPILAFMAWLLWRVFSNHLPHFQKSLDDISERLARLEGRQEERDKHAG